MKTFKISRSVNYVLLVIVLTVSIPMVVAYGQKNEAATSAITTIDIYQMTVDAKDLPVLLIDEPY